MSDKRGLFQIDGLTWLYKGSIAETYELTVAQRTQKELEKRNFSLETATNSLHGVFDFFFAVMGRRPGITVRYCPRDRSHEPRWELAVMSNADLGLVRLGSDTFSTEAKARKRSMLECEADREFLIRPTLNF